MKSRTKQSSSSAAITATTKNAATCDSPKHYPSISAAYWLPAPNTTPYLLPGKESKKFSFLSPSFKLRNEILTSRELPVSLRMCGVLFSQIRKQLEASKNAEQFFSLSHFTLNRQWSFSSARGKHEISFFFFSPKKKWCTERKLFVGMLNKKYNENDVRQMFSTYGTIEECTVLRDPSGQSKGCAFVTFSTKQSAIGAIKVSCTLPVPLNFYSKILFLQALHQSQTMEGCSAPLVVKFADTQKEKDAKRVQTIQNNLWNFAGLNSPLAPSPVPVASPIHSNPPAHTSPYLASDAIPTASLQLLQQIQAFGLQQQLLHGKHFFDHPHPYESLTVAPFIF